MAVRDSLEAAARLENLAAINPVPSDAVMLRLAAADMRARLARAERESLRADLAAGADYAGGSDIIAARVLAAAARVH